MKTLPVAVQNFLSGEEGASATEYAVLIVLIILVALAAVVLLGLEVRGAFEKFLELFNV